MAKSILFTLLVVLLSYSAFGQNYRTAIGLRGSYFGWGAINVKQYISNKHALEFSLGGSQSFLWGEVLYEWNNQVKKLKPLEWYLGVGIATGYYNANFEYKNKFLNGYHIGARGIAGVDITVEGAPINFSLHTGPYVGVANSFAYDWHGSIAIRYAIK